MNDVTRQLILEAELRLAEFDKDGMGHTLNAVSLRSAARVVSSRAE